MLHHVKQEKEVFTKMRCVLIMRACPFIFLDGGYFTLAGGPEMLAL
jgi:hypothetical protein